MVIPPLFRTSRCRRSWGADPGRADALGLVSVSAPDACAQQQQQRLDARSHGEGSPGAVPADELRLATDGVPVAHPSVTIGGEVQWRASTIAPMEARVAGSAPRYVRARTMAGTATIGLTWWPRPRQRRFGVGGEAGYAAAPFWIRDDVVLAPYALHGPIARARLEAWSRRGRVQLLARPGFGAMVPSGLAGAGASARTLAGHRTSPMSW